MCTSPRVRQSVCRGTTASFERRGRTTSSHASSPASFYRAERCRADQRHFEVASPPAAPRPGRYTEESMTRWLPIVGGISLNLALGSLYAWSVFVLPLE